jgi:LEA14-like dessication related protein
MMSLIRTHAEFIYRLAGLGQGRLKISMIMLVAAGLMLGNCQKPDQPIELKRIKDVVVDATTDPMLKAQAVFHNPNNVRMRLKKIKIDIIINGKKTGEIDQDLKTVIPARSEFTVPLEVKLAMKEVGFLDTIFSMLGGKKFAVQYKGVLKLSYHGVPIRVPVDYNDEIRVKF